MDKTENINYCDNAFCLELGVCIDLAETEALLGALDDRLAAAFLEGWEAAEATVESLATVFLEDKDEEEDEEDGFSQEIYQLATAVDSALEHVGEDFAQIQKWADFVNENLDEIYGRLETIVDDTEADAVLLEALAARVADLEQENKNLWQALLSK